MLIAHLADTHLGYRQYGLEEREKDLYDTFREIIDKILEEHVDIVIHSGDLFHMPRPPIRALRVVQQEFSRLKDKGIQIIVVPGSHDLLRRRGITPLVLYDYLNVKMLWRRNPIVVINNIFIGGLEYIPKFYVNILKEYLIKLSTQAKNYEKRILVLHQGIDIAIPIAFELRLADLPKEYNYYAFGHIHKSFNIKYGDGILAYPGSTDILEVNEILDYEKGGKGFFIVDLSSDTPTLHEIKLETIRPQYKLNIEAKQVSILRQKLLEKLKSCDKPPIFHIGIKGKISRHLLENELKDIKARSLLVRYSIHPETISEEQVINLDLDIKRLLKEKVQQSEAAEYAYQLFLLLSNNNMIEAYRETEEFYKSHKWKGVKLFK